MQNYILPLLGKYNDTILVYENILMLIVNFTDTKQGKSQFLQNNGMKFFYLYLIDI